MKEPVANVEPVTKREVQENPALQALLLAWLRALAKVDETSS